jgi:hypothetical protein
MTQTEHISHSDKQRDSSLNLPLLNEQIQQHCAKALEQFKKITKSYVLFHMLFFGLAFLEVLSFLIFFSFLTKSALLAFSLAGLFLTAFSYFVLLFYFQAKKPEQLIQLREEYLEACTTSFALEKTSLSIALAQAMYRLSDLLEGQEAHFYRLKIWIPALEPLIEKFSTWSHWKDTHHMREMLLRVSVQEQIKRVKYAPADIETHAALASSYIVLCKLYRDPRKSLSEESTQWIPSDYSSEEMQQKFKTAAERAIEEFKILDNYSPNDSWIHAQLADLYHDL